MISRHGAQRPGRCAAPFGTSRLTPCSKAPSAWGEGCALCAAAVGASRPLETLLPCTSAVPRWGKRRGTAFCSMGPSYQQIFDQCPSNVSLMQTQTYGSWSSGCCTYMQGHWAKTVWSIKTSSLSKSPQQLWDEVKKWHSDHPESKGLFSWTAETSSKCSPPFCAETVASVSRHDMVLASGLHSSQDASDIVVGRRRRGWTSRRTACLIASADNAALLCMYVGAFNQ